MFTSPSMAALKTAQRVLTALSGRGPLRPEDLDRLRRFAPALMNEPPDELACDVIKQALQIRAAVRAVHDRQ